MMAVRLVVYATLLLTGCVTTAGGPRTTRTCVVLQVENHNWSRAVIYATRSGGRYRVGDIGTGRRKAMAVPMTYTSDGTLELFIRFIGSNATLVTHPIPVSRGQHVEVILRNYVPFSTVTPLMMVGPPRAA